MHGKEHFQTMLPLFEGYLDKASGDEGSYDAVRQGVVVFLGTLARHLDPTNPKVRAVCLQCLLVCALVGS